MHRAAVLRRPHLANDRFLEQIGLSFARRVDLVQPPGEQQASDARSNLLAMSRDQLCKPFSRLELFHQETRGKALHAEPLSGVESGRIAMSNRGAADLTDGACGPVNLNVFVAIHTFGIEVADAKMTARLQIGGVRDGKSRR